MGSKSQDISPPPSPPETPSVSIENPTDFVISTLSLPKRYKKSSRNNFKNNKVNGRLGRGNYYKMTTPSSRSTCVNTVRRSRQPTVAIATQVLNPRSLKGQGISRGFGQSDDDEEGFFTYHRKREVWRRLCYYGIATAATILIIMALILAVGYFQSEKHIKSTMTRSVKLVQERRPLSYIYTSTPPPSLEIVPTDSQEYFPTTHSSFFLHSKELGGYESKEFYPESLDLDSTELGKSEKSIKGSKAEQEQDYIVNYELDPLEDLGVKLEKGGENNGGNEVIEIQDKAENLLEDEDDNKSSKLSTHPLSQDQSFDIDSLSKPESEADEDNAQEITTVQNSEDEEETERDNRKSSIVLEKDDTIPETIGDRLPSEVKVRPPQDTAFSIEIPIYKTNKTISSFEQEVNDEEYKEASDSPKESHELRGNFQKVNELPLIITEVNDKETLIPFENETSVPPTKNRGNFVNPKEFGGKTEVSLPDHDDHDKFHESILHTVLFQEEDEDELEDFDKSPKEDYPSTQSALPKADVVSREKGKVPLEKTESKLTRNRGRSRKIKIVKNDTLMNFKASYAPHSRNLKEKQLEKESSGLAPKIDLDDDSGDFGNIKDFVMDPDSTSLRRTQVRPRPPTDTLPEKEKPRMLPSSTSFSSNVEAFLRSILQSAGKLNLHEAQEPHKRISEAPHSFPDFGVGSTPTLNLNSNFNHFLPPTSQLQSPPAASPYPGLELDSSHLSKRTYNSEYDFQYPRTLSTSSSTNIPTSQSENYFNHLLGYNPSLGSIGSPSVAGASLNNFYSNYFPTTQSSLGQFDISSSGSDESPKLAPGVVPFDLASSYIPSTLSLPKSGGNNNNNNNNNQNAFLGGNQYNQQFLRNPVANPYNNFNFGGIGDIGSVTTISGHPPTYNTISQGMNLLNMISGVVPNTYFHDQVYPPPQSTSPLTLSSGFDTSSSLNPSTSPPAHHHFKKLSQEGVLTNQDSGTVRIPSHPELSQLGPDPSSSSHSYLPFPHVNFREEEDSRAENDRSVYYSPPSRSRTRSRYHKKEDYYNDEEPDQLPAASSSFSQSILTTVKNPNFRVGMKSTTATSRETPSVVLPPPRNTIEAMIKPTEKTITVDSNPSWKSQTEPKSYTFDILPGRHKPGAVSPSDNIIDSTLNGLNADIIHSSLDAFVSGSKSKKKSGANLQIEKALPKGEKSKESQSSGKVLKLKGYEFPSKSKSTTSSVTDHQTKIEVVEPNHRPMHNHWPRKIYPKPQVAAGLQSGFYRV